jgi:ferredoxin--NADP+ reductase
MEEQLGSAKRPLRVAVVGSGPSGFYAIGALFKASDLRVEVDLFDRLPTPFGLVRGGVAPDHQKIKKVIRVYDKTAEHKGFRFFGNVKIGRDLQVDDLLRHYDQVVYATGNETDRALGIPGEELEGVHSGTEFVGWYNGHPDFKDRQFDLAKATRVAVIGIGNVSVDVVRVLSKHPDELAATDIADYALEDLGQSSVRDILLLGRRGPAQSAWSPKEIKELGSLKHADLVVAPEEVELDDLSREWMDSTAPRAARKNFDYLTARSKEARREGSRGIICNFLASPVELIGKDGRLHSMRVERNELYEDDKGVPRPKGTGQFVVEEVQLLFKAVGYRGIPIPGVPFNDRWGTFPNTDGRLCETEGGKQVPDQYVVGWAKRGPSGLIGSNGPCAEQTVRCMVEDVRGKTAPLDDAKNPQAIVDLLDSRNIPWVSYADWKNLDAEEIARGKARGKIRDKLSSVDEMLEVIRAARAS